MFVQKKHTQKSRWAALSSWSWNPKRNTTAATPSPEFRWVESVAVWFWDGCLCCHLLPVSLQCDFCWVVQPLSPPTHPHPHVLALMNTHAHTHSLSTYIYIVVKTHTHSHTTICDDNRSNSSRRGSVTSSGSKRSVRFSAEEEIHTIYCDEPANRRASVQNVDGTEKEPNKILSKKEKLRQQVKSRLVARHLLMAIQSSMAQVNTGKARRASQDMIFGIEPMHDNTETAAATAAATKDVDLPPEGTDENPQTPP